MTMGKEKRETRNWALSEKLHHEYIDRVASGNIRRKGISVFIPIILSAWNFAHPSSIHLPIHPSIHSIHIFKYLLIIMLVPESQV